MKKNRKAVRTVSAVLAVVLCLSGCFDRRELDKLGYIVGAAIDKAETEGEIELTLQLANVSKAGSSDKKGSKTSKDSSSKEGTPFINVTNTGKTVNSALRDFEHMISRRVYTPHMQVLLFGEELAREGVRDSLDFFARAPEARMTLYVLVAKGKASDILNIATQFETYPSVALMMRVENQDITSDTPIVTEYQFVTTMMNKSTAAIAPLVEIVEEGDSQRLSVGGCAVFKDSVMTGEMDRTETRGLLWVKGEVKKAILDVESAGCTRRGKIRKAKTKITPEVKEDGTILFHIRINTTVGLGDQTGTVNLADPDNVPIFLDKTEEVIRDEIQSAWNKSLELNADVFGFGEMIARRFPDKWESIKNQWDELYQTVQVEINVNAKADSFGRTVMPLAPED